MPLEKVLIINTETGERIAAMFNPSEYTLAMNNNFAEVGIPGLQGPPIQFVQGGLTNLKLDLFFDSYEKRSDVRDYTKKIAALLEKNAKSKAPPVLLFSWGNFNFKCVMDSVSQRFTMFLDNGIPVRATLGVTFKEFRSAEIEIQKGFFVGPPTIHNVIEGQNLSDIAASTLGDPSAWRQLAELNNVDNPRTIAPGTILQIPKNRTASSGSKG